MYVYPFLFPAPAEKDVEGHFGGSSIFLVAKPCASSAFSCRAILTQIVMTRKTRTTKATIAMVTRTITLTRLKTTALTHPGLWVRWHTMITSTVSITPMLRLQKLDNLRVRTMFTFQCNWSRWTTSWQPEAWALVRKYCFRTLISWRVGWKWNVQTLQRPTWTFPRRVLYWKGQGRIARLVKRTPVLLMSYRKLESQRLIGLNSIPRWQQIRHQPTRH